MVALDPEEGKSRKSRGRKEAGTDLEKKEKTKIDCLRFWVFLQVASLPTAGAEGERRR